MTILLLVLVLALAGCDSSPSSPLAPTAARPPAPPSAALQPPSVATISPIAGSVAGDTPAIIRGAGFQSGATVTLGGVAAVRARSDHRDPAGTILYLETPSHAAGAVDVVVTNPDGQSARLTGGYTFAAQHSFDFNGTWSGFGNAGQDTPIGFIIQNNLLVSVSCHGSEIAELTFSPPLPVSDGAFSFSRDDGVRFSGRIVSAAAAVGTINFAACTGTIWGASRRR